MTTSRNVVKFALMKISAKRMEEGLTRILDERFLESGIGLCSITNEPRLYTNAVAVMNIECTPDALGNYWLYVFDRYGQYETALNIARVFAQEKGLELLEPFSPDWILARCLTDTIPAGELRTIYLLRDLVIVRSVAGEKMTCAVVKNPNGPVLPPGKKIFLSAHEGPFEQREHLDDPEAKALAASTKQVWFQAVLVDQPEEV